MARQNAADVREMARWALEKFMAECSEARTCTSWADDNAYVLWRDVLEAPDAPLPTTRNDEFGWQVDAQRLRRLSQLAGGWYHWSESTDRVVFMALPEWRAHYAAVWAPRHPARTLEQRLEEERFEAERLRARRAQRPSKCGSAQDESATDAASEAELLRLLERDDR